MVCTGEGPEGVGPSLRHQRTSAGWYAPQRDRKRFSENVPCDRNRRPATANCTYSRSCGNDCPVSFHALIFASMVGDAITVEYALQPAHIVPTAIFATEASMERATLIRTARVPQNFLVRVENDSPSAQRKAARAWLQPWFGWCGTRGPWWMRMSRGRRSYKWLAADKSFRWVMKMFPGFGHGRWAAAAVFARLPRWHVS